MDGKNIDTENAGDAAAGTFSTSSAAIAPVENTDDIAPRRSRGLYSNSILYFLVRPFYNNSRLVASMENESPNA